MTTEAIISKLHSCRAFSKEPTQEQSESVRNFAFTVAAPRPQVARSLGIRVVVIPRSADWCVKETVGMVRGPFHWVAAVARNPVCNYSGLVALGRWCQKVALFVSSLGLGEVWIGDGRLAEGDIKTDLALGPGECVVSFLCYGVRDADAKSDPSPERKRFGEVFFDRKFGTELSADSLTKDVAACLEAVRLAPSAFNIQPWRIVAEKGCSRLHLFDSDLTGDWSGLSIGIAMEHFEAVARERGMLGRWTVAAFPPCEIVVPSNVRYVATWIGAKCRL